MAIFFYDCKINGCVLLCHILLWLTQIFSRELTTSSANLIEQPFAGRVRKNLWYPEYKSYRYLEHIAIPFTVLQSFRFLCELTFERQSMQPQPSISNVNSFMLPEFNRCFHFLVPGDPALVDARRIVGQLHMVVTRMDT